MAEFSGSPNGAGRTVAIAASRFNEDVTRKLVEGALDALVRHGAALEDIDVVWVPGAWELPVAVRDQLHDQPREDDDERVVDEGDDATGREPQVEAERDVHHDERDRVEQRAGRRDALADVPFNGGRHGCPPPRTCRTCAAPPLRASDAGPIPQATPSTSGEAPAQLRSAAVPTL